MMFPSSSVFIVAFFSFGVTAEPIFFNSGGKEILNRKRHLFSHRPPHRPGPPHRGPQCLPMQPPKTKYITKTSTTSIYETFFETEFFPKTVFDTRLKQTIPIEPSTVTSTTTSTQTNTKIEPVYITTTELEPTSITTTITHVIYDTRHLLSSLFHTRVTPQVTTQTVWKDVYHTDVETVTIVRTNTMTRTETVRDPDCSTVSSGPFSSGSSLDPRSKFNKDPFSPPYLASAYSNDAFNDISHSNSEPLKTFTEPLPQPSFDHSDHQLGMAFHGGGNYYRPSNPFNSVYYPSIIGSTANPFLSFNNKLYDFYGESDPNSFRNADPQKASTYSQSVKSFKYGSEDAYRDDIDAYSPITPKDKKFEPSRPDPTSISDILASDSYSEEEKPFSYRKPKRLYGDEVDLYGVQSAYDSEGEEKETKHNIKEGAVYITDYSDHGRDIHMKGANGASDSYSEEEKPFSYRKPKRLYGDEVDLYGVQSAYDSEGEEKETKHNIKEGAVYITDYSDHGGDIHIKEIMKGVKGGEIYEEIHNHGLIAPTYPVIYQPEYTSSYHQSPYSSDYQSDTSVFNYETSIESQSQNNHYSDLSSSRTRLSALLKQSLNLDDDDDRFVYPLVPREIEYSGHTKSDQVDGYDNSRLPKPDYFGRSPLDVYPKRTLFRSEVLKGKPARTARNLGSRRGFGSQGAHSTPVVTNLNGSHVLDLYSNTSSNTFIPSKLVDVGIGRISVNDDHTKNLFLHEQPMRNNLLRTRSGKKFEDNSRNKVTPPEVVRGLEVAKDENDWVPLSRKIDSNKQSQFDLSQTRQTR